MTDLITRPVTLAVAGRPVSTVGLVVAFTPGLVITPWYVPGGALRGRFTLAHAPSGLVVAARHWCPHDARRWAVAAGWIGVDWEAPAFTVCASGPARVFAWRLVDEWRPRCPECTR